ILRCKLPLPPPTVTVSATSMQPFAPALFEQPPISTTPGMTSVLPHAWPLDTSGAWPEVSGQTHTWVPTPPGRQSASAPQAITLLPHDRDSSAAATNKTFFIAPLLGFAFERTPGHEPLSRIPARPSLLGLSPPM